MEPFTKSAWILRAFTPRTLGQVLLAVLLQRRLVLQSGSSAALTHAILLVTKVLISPFHYPYPVIYIAPP